jgi:hypothetical protein
LGLAITLAVGLILATALIHYEGLRILSLWLTISAMTSRRKVLATVLSIVPIHIAEVALYAVGYWLADAMLEIGDFKSDHGFALADYFFFSAEAFTTLGLGDVTPTGPMRLLAGIEAINGFLLIGWSVSFTFFEMQRYWSDDYGSRT